MGKKFAHTRYKSAPHVDARLAPADEFGKMVVAALTPTYTRIYPRRNVWINQHFPTISLHATASPLISTSLRSGTKQVCTTATAKVFCCPPNVFAHLQRKRPTSATNDKQRAQSHHRRLRPPRSPNRRYHSRYHRT